MHGKVSDDSISLGIDIENAARYSDILIEHIEKDLLELKRQYKASKDRHKHEKVHDKDTTVRRKETTNKNGKLMHNHKKIDVNICDKCERLYSKEKNDVGQKNTLKDSECGTNEVKQSLVLIHTCERTKQTRSFCNNADCEVNFIKSPIPTLPSDEGFVNKDIMKLKAAREDEIQREKFSNQEKILSRERSRSHERYILSSGRKDIPKPTRMDWNNYHRLNVIHSFIDDLEFNFPSICTSGVIGKSLEGRDLKILKISNSDASNASVWMDAGIHAREWIAPAVATYVADHIARNFSTLPQSITNKDWYFLPVMNPDGYEYSHTTDRMWRKNRASFRGQRVGVDLNRNFSHGWGGKGSSDTPTHAFFRGPEPFSESESSAVRDLLAHSGIQFKVYITLHSYGQVILFPFAYREELCPDYIRLLEGATVMSRAINESSGQIYKVGISRDVMYGAAGTSNDWSYGTCHIPFCYLIELRSKEHRFRLPKEEIEITGQEILASVKALMEFVDSCKI